VRPGSLLALICGAGVALGACSDGDRPSSSATTTTVRAPTTAPTSTGGRLAVEGNATLDGVPFDARFLGAVVLRDGLATACQANISSVFEDGYRIDVVPQAESAGCGRAGDRVALWTYVRGRKLYTTSTVTWPEQGNRATFDARFDTAKPPGAAPPVTELSGTVTGGNGRAAPVGTRVEAYIGGTRCGVASVRRFSENYTGYVLSVVGPDSIPTCARDGRIVFRIDGRPARQTYVNRLTPPASGSGGSFPLTTA
jgi:hypothetical protein